MNMNLSRKVLISRFQENAHAEKQDDLRMTKSLEEWKTKTNAFSPEVHIFTYKLTYIVTRFEMVPFSVHPFYLQGDFFCPTSQIITPKYLPDSCVLSFKNI